MKEEFKTRNGVFDRFTINTLKDLDSSGFFNIETLSPISEGKESHVFLAKREQTKENVVVKIHCLETADFNKMLFYIQDDLRFSAISGNKRKTILAWAKREAKNLSLAREAHVACPKPYIVKNNVLVMQSIETLGVPSPKLKDIELSNQTKTFNEKLFKKSFEYLGRLKKAGLAHGDLSAFNILVKSGLPYFIDFSHTISLETKSGAYLFKRDFENLFTFFQKYKIGNKKTAEKLSKLNELTY